MNALQAVFIRRRAMAYDVLGRLANLVDGIGTTRFTYDTNGFLWSEDGPWAADTLTYQTVNGLHSSLTLAEPNGLPWIQSYGYDAANRMTNVTSPAGAFGYGYTGVLGATTPGDRVQRRTLPNGLYVTNVYDTMARLMATSVRNSGPTALVSDQYEYNVLSQVAGHTRTDGGYLGFNDLNGSLTTDGVRSFAYDDENQLTQVTIGTTYRAEFVYHGLGRRRIKRDCLLLNGYWITNEVRYICDGYRVLQERNASNQPKVTYTRGLDLSAGQAGLSGSLEGAGGIGGLLARTSNPQLVAGDSASAHAYCHADGNGNVTCVLDTRQQIAARYLYDPFGNTLSLSGPPADANTLRFSSKEWHEASGLYYYGFRYYDPNLQRWLNQDPLGEGGGLNLYGFAGNCPACFFDPYGFSWFDDLANWARCQHQQFSSRMLSTAGDGNSWVMVGFWTTVSEVAAGTLSHPQKLSNLGCGSRKFAGNPTLLNAAGVFEDISDAATVAAMGVAPVPSANGIRTTPQATKLPFPAANGTVRALTEAEKALYGRVAYPKGFREQVWERAKAPDGNVYDPNGRIMNFDEPWQLGHKPGHKFSDAQARAAQEGWDRQTWIRHQTDPDIYRPELPSSNASPRWE